MRTKKEMRTKPIALRLVTLMMATIYLMHPIHKEIGRVFHGLSHSIQASEDVLSHKFGILDMDQHHLEYHHKSFSSRHHHIVLDFINAIFNGASDTHIPGSKSTLTKNNLDKHLVTEVRSAKSILVSKTHWFFPDTFSPLLKGYVRLQYPPPQLS